MSAACYPHFNVSYFGMNSTRRDFLTAAVPATLMLLPPSCSVAANSSVSANHRPILWPAQEDWGSLLARRSADPDLDRLVISLLDRARKDLKLPLLERKLEGRRLLGVSREFIRRGLQWAFAYRIGAGPSFRDRALQEALNIAAFSDWHPEHYLDVAEMTAGMAIVYNWLHDDLSEADRSMLRAAILDKGITQARYGHKTFQAENNWNQVCIGGMTLGALALEPDQPALAGELLAAARKAVGKGLDAYRPEGVYPEGPGYWDYGTSYSVLTVAALRAAFQTDWGILSAPGFLRSAEFYAYAIGPTGKAFNFADGSESTGFPCAVAYLARELGQPPLLASMRQSIRARQGLSDRFAPLTALWWTSAGEAKPSSTTFSAQGAQPVAIWRSSWADPDCLWFAIKGGGAAQNHGHMDAGSFVLDLDGIRWARDLGMQEYNSLESRGIDLWNMKQNSARWRVFRLSAAAHNTLTLNDQPHNASGMATLRSIGTEEALVDLTPVFLPGMVRTATRRVQVNGTTVQMNDEVIGASANASIRWAMNTEAAIQIDGNTALLRQQGKNLTIRFEGSGLLLDVLEISAPRHDFDAPNPGVRQLVATGRPQADGTWKIGVRFVRGQPNRT